MKSRLFTVSMFLIALIALVWVAHHNVATAQPAPQADSPAGKSVHVYLRGDATGVAFHDRAPDVSYLATLNGTLVSVDNDWVIVDGPHGRQWIARSAVAMVEQAK